MSMKKKTAKSGKISPVVHSFIQFLFDASIERTHQAHSTY